MGPARRSLARPELFMVAALCAAAVVLVAAAVIGGRRAETSLTAAGDGGPSLSESRNAARNEAGTSAARASESPGEAVAPVSAAKQASAPRRPGVPLERKSSAGATRLGVFSDHVEVGVHAPITFDGAPLNLAEDPVTGVKGYVTYVNRSGGINGLKVRLIPEDDRYTTAGGRQAADRLTKEVKPFLIEGALGIDQIHKVATAAKAGGFPYIAGGGPEPEFAEITDMYQNISSYDQFAEMVAQFICKYGAGYVGGTKPTDVRLGTTTLNSEFILPVEKRLVKKLTDRNCVREPVDANARGTINKPTEQSTYSSQMIDLRGAYGNQARTS